MARDLIKQLRKAQRRLTDAGDIGREERANMAVLICKAIEAMNSQGGPHDN